MLHLGEADSRHEACRLPGVGDLFIQLIDLLQRKSFEHKVSAHVTKIESSDGESSQHTFGFIDEEMDKYRAQNAKGTPDEKHFGAKVGVAFA